MKKTSRHILETIVAKGIMSIAFISFAVIVLIFAFIVKESFSVVPQKKNAVHSPDTIPPQETYGDDGIVERPEFRTQEAAEAGNPLPTILGTQWQPVSLNPRFGLLPLFMGTLKVTLIALLLATPLGIFAALFSSFFAPSWVREIIKPIVEILAGFPSVVIGFFALTVLASLLQHTFHLQYRLNAFTGGCALSLAIIPIIFTITEDALSLVPKSLREASIALGAAPWQTALFVVLPAATPGVFAAVLLGFGRAFGETMIVLMATGNAALLSLNPFEPVRTLSATIGAEMAEVVFGDIHYGVLFLIGTVLLLISFGLNFIAEFFVRKRLMLRFAGK